MRRIPMLLLVLLATIVGAGTAQASTKAVGAIARGTDVEGRYLVQAIDGNFARDAKVSVFTLQGDLIGEGKVHSVYNDELYVDIPGVPEDAVAPGFAVCMNYTDAEARKLLAARRDALLGVKSEARKEADRRGKEIAVEARREQLERERYQEEMEKFNAQLDYSYYATRWYGWGWGWGW